MIGTVAAPSVSLHMQRAIDAADTARLRTAPNPWVGCVVITADGQSFVGATEPPGMRHAEVVALDAARAAGADTRGAEVFVTLEPCSHQGRTGPCVDRLVAAGVQRVTIAVQDPDPRVAGSGIAALRSAGIEVGCGDGEQLVREQLRAYLHHRTTGRPFVVMKVAATLDGRTAARDGSSQWITGEAARRRVHQLRAESQAVCTGAGTVRADDPQLTVRHVEGPDPLRVVLGAAPPDARVHPCIEWEQSLDALLAHLGERGVLQLLVEAGPRASASFHRSGLVDRYVFHLAPALAGGDAPGMFDGCGVSNIEQMWRGRIVSTRVLGDDLEVVIEP